MPEDVGRPRLTALYRTRSDLSAQELQRQLNRLRVPDHLISQCASKDELEALLHRTLHTQSEMTTASNHAHHARAPAIPAGKFTHACTQHTVMMGLRAAAHSAMSVRSAEEFCFARVASVHILPLTGGKTAQASVRTLTPSHARARVRACTH